MRARIGKRVQLLVRMQWVIVQLMRVQLVRVQLARVLLLAVGACAVGTHELVARASRDACAVGVRAVGA
eukprot:2794111-Pleurochrysis_carterae.AAC.2